jgi:hypothetical protein
MSRFSEEKPIDPKKYRFIPSRVADPINKEKIAKMVTFFPETYRRVDKLAKKEKIPLSSALEIMLNTEEAKAIAPANTEDWIKKLKKQGEPKYASYNLFTKPKTRRQANGITKGIPPEI